MFAGTGSGNFIHILDLHLKRLREIPVHPLQHRFTGAFLIVLSLDDHCPEMARRLLLELNFSEPMPEDMTRVVSRLRSRSS